MTPPTPAYRFLDHPGPIAFAHRGGAAESPENTRRSFAHARDLGYRYVETDVHATADGVVAVIHDPLLDRVADRRGSVADLPWREVAAARVGGGEAVPRLDELLAEWPELRWNIDAKHEAVVEPLVEVLRRTGSLERVCVTSFSDARVARVRALAGPSVCTATGPRGIASIRLASLVPPLAPLVDRWRGAGAAQIPIRWGALPVADRRFVDFAHRRGLAVHVWTVDDPVVAGRLLDVGVDGVMTDRPSALKDLLVERGLWVDPASWT